MKALYRPPPPLFLCPRIGGVSVLFFFSSIFALQVAPNPCCAHAPPFFFSCIPRVMLHQLWCEAYFPLDTHIHRLVFSFVAHGLRAVRYTSVGSSPNLTSLFQPQGLRYFGSLATRPLAGKANSHPTRASSSKRALPVWTRKGFGVW